MSVEAPVIGIVGGGASGCMLAIRLMRQSEAPLDIRIFESGETLGLGVAYALRDPGLLMNGPAGIFSLDPDDESQFTRWCASHCRTAHGAALDMAQAATLYAPRYVYGDYVQHALRQAHLERPQHRLEHIRARVTALSDEALSVRLQLEDGSAHDVGQAVLAVGIFKSRPGFADEPSLGERYVADPWERPALPLPSRAASIAIIGSGLTMIDTVLRLEGQGYKGDYNVISTHGLVPFSRVDAPSWQRSADWPPREGASLRELLRLYRHLLAAETRLGGHWQALCNELTMHVCQRWTQVSVADRQRFLRHVRPYWAQFVHRAPPGPRARIQGLQDEGRLRLLAGTVISVKAEGRGRAALVLRGRGSEAQTRLVTDLVINAAGLHTKWSVRSSDPLVTQLVKDGVVVPERLGLGIELDKTQAVLDERGTPRSGVFAMGPAASGLWYESTALRALRMQAIGLAHELISRADAMKANMGCDCEHR